VLHLWTHAEESYLLHHYLRIYFPWAHGKPSSQRLSHSSLVPQEQARLVDTGLLCFRFMHDAKLWEEQRLRELNVSMYVFMAWWVLVTLATEAQYFQSPRFLIRQRPKFSSFEVQFHRG
jgi:hypothetical protein